MVQYRRLAAAASATALLGAGIALAAPAQAAQPVAPCTWEAKDPDNTFNCGKATTQRPRVAVTDCWKYPPSERSYTLRKTASGWTRVNLGLKVREGAGCTESHPYKTVMRLPTSDLKPYQTARYRLVMPATTGVDDSGAEWAYGKTVLDVNICLVRPGSIRDC